MAENKLQEDSPFKGSISCNCKTTRIPNIYHVQLKISLQHKTEEIIPHHLKMIKLIDH